MKTKICSRCKIEKSLDDFMKDKTGKYISGVQSCCKICESNRKKLERKQFPHRQRQVNLKRFYGMTIEQYENKLQSQDCKCEICGIHQDKLDYKMYIDHNHTTNKIRGLLCRMCNYAIGHANDDIAILKNAIKYLQENN